LNVSEPRATGWDAAESVATRKPPAPAGPVAGAPAGPVVGNVVAVWVVAPAMGWVAAACCSCFCRSSGSIQPCFL
jgi:hypothetical protein